MKILVPNWRAYLALWLVNSLSFISTTKVTLLNNVVEELGIFAKCQNEWCHQKGLQKPQHTKCESVTNNGKTCNNPEIRYGTAIGGFPFVCFPYINTSDYYGKWCEQLGGVYASHITTGTRTGYAVCGCKYYDDHGNWHWCDLSDGYWYNQSLDYYETSNNFITSITCMNWIKICDFKSKILSLFSLL